MKVVWVALLSFFAASSGLATSLEVSPGVTLIPGSFVPNVEPDGNSVVIRGTKGLVVIDTGRHPSHTEAIVDYARAAALPIAAVINTHWHLDHISGNSRIRRQFPAVRVYASNALDGALRGFLAEERATLVQLLAKPAVPQQLVEWRAELATIDDAPQLRPDEVITSSAHRTIAGRKLFVGLEDHAVTAGDVWVLDEKSGVLIAGDLVTLPAPLFDTACPARWKASLDSIHNTKFRLLIPGHGAPMNRDAFERYRQAFDHLLTCAYSSEAASACTSGWMSDSASLISGEDPLFVRSLLDYYIAQDLRGAPAARRKFCSDS